MKTVAVIGVGKMGLPIASHLLKAGYSVKVFDSAKDRLQLASDEGLTITNDIAECLLNADVIFSSLPDDTALRSVAATVSGNAKRGSIYVDTSTVSITASAEVAPSLSDAGIAYLRATISGNNHMLAAGQVTVMASGPAEAWAIVEPLMAHFSPTRFYLGPAEQARLMKLVINLMIAQTSAMLAEALTLGDKGGLDWQSMWQVITASAVASPIVKAKAAQLTGHDYTPTFTVSQMLKDIDLILAAGDSVEAPLPQTSLTRQSMVSAIAQGMSGDDYAAIIKVAQRSAAANRNER
jgi:3-hydroxyisobutyrate dehydrogenase-like beta-hydroxyacid dehydrogenase